MLPFPKRNLYSEKEFPFVSMSTFLYPKETCGFKPLETLFGCGEEHDVCACVCITCAIMYRDPWTTWVALLHHWQVVPFKQRLSLNSELAGVLSPTKAGQAGHQVPETLLSLPHTALAMDCIRVSDLNQGPHVCIASTLSTESPACCPMAYHLQLEALS